MSDNQQTDAIVIKESVTLPVGIIIDGVRHTEVELRPITIGQSYEASMNARASDLQVLVDTAVMTYVPKLMRHLTYDEVANASRQDGNRLETARLLLEKKERDQATASA